jgi:ferredoxin
MTLRVTVDRMRCDGHALCLLNAPDVFELDETEHAVVTNPTPSEEERGAVLQARLQCPTQAITVEDDERS